MIRSILIVCVFCILVVFRGTIIASLLRAAGDFIAGPLGITEEASASLALALVQFGLDSISALVAIVGLWGGICPVEAHHNRELASPQGRGSVR